MLRKFIQFILKKKAKKVLKHHQPLVIAITGSVGKSSTKEMIALGLSSFFNLRKSPLNYNNEFGLPLAILGEKNPERNFGQWLKLFWRTRKVHRSKNFPEMLILEMAADHPGDINYLLNIVQPNIGILTAIAPCHLEYFKNLDNVKKEKMQLMTSLKQDGWAIFNNDDSNLKDIKSQIKAKVLTYGFEATADISPLEIQLNQKLNGKRVYIFGLSFKVKCQGNIIPVFLPRVLSFSTIYAVLATMAVSAALNINLLEVSENLKKYKPLDGRMNLISGKNKTLIINDSYNSSPQSVESALFDLDQIKNHPQTKKWLVLGDMLELGRKSEYYHRKIGEEIAWRKSYNLIGIGEFAYFIVEQAKIKGMSKEQAIYFKEKEEALKYLLDNIKEGDIILVKGSRKMKMEELVKKLT